MAWVRKVTQYPSWTAGARSIATLTGDGEFTFHAGPAVGIVAGLNDNDQSGDYQEISHGFYISNSYLKVIESGVLKTTWYNYNSFYELAIQRVGGVVSYLLDGSIIYTSDVLSYETVFFDCSLYADGDTITDLTCTETFNPSPNPLGLSLSPLICFGTEVDCVGRGLLSPLALNATAFEQTYDGSTYLALSPLIGRGSESGNFGRASLSPLAVNGAVDGEEIIPDYNFGAIYLNPLFASGVVADVTSASLSLSPLDAFGTQTTDGIGFGLLEPLSMYGDILVDNNFLIFLPTFTGYADYNDTILTIPAPEIDIAGTVYSSAITAVIPAPTLTLYGGATTGFEIPSPVLTAAGTVQNLARVEFEIPALTLTATGLTGLMASFAATIPEPEIQMYGGGTVDFTIPALEATSAGTVNALATVAFEIPALELAATGTVGSVAKISVEIPALELYAGLGNRVEFEIPALILSAVASPANTADETTYAINLTTGAVTQLLLGGFDKLVTAHGRLYGLKSGALTRLEGNVDGTVTTIPATIRFAPQTFGSNAVKRMSDVYWSTREADGITMELVADERTVWRYQTPTDTAPAYGTHKIKTGRGVSFHTAGLTVRNRNGGALDIGGVELLVSPLSRKPK
jgi:hypothetical protein